MGTARVGLRDPARHRRADAGPGDDGSVTHPRLASLPVLPAVLAVLALGATACDAGGGDADPSSAPSPSATSPDDQGSDAPTAPASPGEQTTITGTPAPVDPGGGPTTYDDALARFDEAGGEPEDEMRFETADGTYCLLDSDFAIGCELPSGGIPDADYCGDGPTQNIGRIVLDLDGPGDPKPECNSDTIREPDAPVVEAGAVVESSATGVRCLVEDIGVTCLDPGREQGFFLGPDTYTVFTA